MNPGRDDTITIIAKRTFLPVSSVPTFSTVIYTRPKNSYRCKFNGTKKKTIGNYRHFRVITIVSY